MAAFESAITHPGTALDNTVKRDVSDELRHLWPRDSRLFALVAKGPVGEDGIKRAPLQIGKREVRNTKFECFTYAPLTTEYTVSSVSTNDYTLDSVDGLTPAMCVVNTSNNTFGRIGAVNTGTSVVSVTPTGPSAAQFTAVAGDVIIITAPVYAENSNSPYMAVNDDTQIYNYTMIVRIALEMSNTAAAVDRYTTGDYFMQKRKQAFIEGMIKTERSFLLSERANSGETTTDNTLGDSYRTMRGMYYWKDSEYNAGGGMTHEMFFRQMALTFDETVDSDTTLMMFCSNEVKARMLGWVQDKLMVMQKPTYEQYGVGIETFTTSRGKVTVMTHDTFNRGSFKDNWCIFNPETLRYCYLQGRDLKINKNIQNNDVDGRKDEILGEISMDAVDGGKQIMFGKNWY